MLMSKYKFNGTKHQNKIKLIVWNVKLLSVATYTNPSLSQSKGREASSGAELYFVVKALDLEFNKLLQDLKNI